MTTDARIARRKLSLLELAQDLGNVSRACKLVGYSRQQFYEIRRNYQTYGAAGLVDRASGPRTPHPNRVAPEIEAAILDHALAQPTHGPMRVAHELALRGLQVSAGGVRRWGWIVSPRASMATSCSTRFARVSGRFALSIR